MCAFEYIFIFNSKTLIDIPEHKLDLFLIKITNFMFVIKKNQKILFSVKRDQKPYK